MTACSGRAGVGYEESRTVVLYFIQDDAGSIALVVTYSGPYSSSYLTTGLIIDSPDLKDDLNIDYILKDDSGQSFSEDVGQPCATVC